MQKRIPTKTPIWNMWDEFALLVGNGRWSNDKKSLEYVRYPGEDNKQLRDRTRETTKNQGDSSQQGLINTISKDLGVSVSGGGLLPWYNSVTKSIFYLSEKPWPGPSGVRVYVSSSGTWTSSDESLPRVRASGYASSVSGWILWNLADIDPEIIPSGLPGSRLWWINQGDPSGYSSSITWGENSTILEFIGSSIPETGDRVRVDYLVQTENDDYGRAVLNWRSDFSHPDNPLDTRFVGLKSDIPTDEASFNAFMSGHVGVWDLANIAATPLSGTFYDSDGRATSKLSTEIKDLITTEFPLTWGKFTLDKARWDQLRNSSIGVIPSFHDDPFPSGSTIYGGVRDGIDLDIVDVYQTGTSANDPWYPMVAPGEFYIGKNRFYLFGRMMIEKVALTASGSVLSGQITASGDDMPSQFDMILGASGAFLYNNSNYPSGNPYICQLPSFHNPMSGLMYREPFLNFGSGAHPSGLPFNCYNFYYDYETGTIWTSGVATDDFYLIWEHRDVAVSGILVTVSGWNSWFDPPNMNPYTDPNNKILYVTEG